MTELTPADMQQHMHQDDWVVVDVRQPWEFEEENLTDHNVPLHDIPGRLEELEGWKDKHVVLYCNTGQNSLMACQLLEEAGFPNVYHLEGGIEAWKDA